MLIDYERSIGKRIRFQGTVLTQETRETIHGHETDIVFLADEHIIRWTASTRLFFKPDDVVSIVATLTSHRLNPNGPDEAFITRGSIVADEPSLI